MSLITAEMRMKEYQNRDQDNYEDWLMKEQEFHDQQDKKRAILRIEQERYQPVDYMIQAILVYKSVLKHPSDIQYMKNPELIIKSLTNEEVQTCLAESEFQMNEEGKFFVFKRILLINCFGDILLILSRINSSLKFRVKMMRM